MATTSVEPEVTKKSVTVDAVPYFSMATADEEFMDVMVRVSASPDKLTKRVPIDLVVVVDVSSDDSKLDMHIKRAMGFIVEQLDDGDRIAVIAFNNAVAESTPNLLRISASSKARALAKEIIIRKLQGKSGTPFKPGLEQAVNILGGRSDDTKNRLGFILLLSDGDDKSPQVQWWEWDKKAKKAPPSSTSDDSENARALLLKLKRRYPVHTFGLGAAHDAKPLFFIAQESVGTYSFVRNRHLGDFTEALAVCLIGLKSIVAIDTKIQVAPGSKAVEIKRIGYHGTGFQGRLEPGTNTAKFDVGTLYAGEKKSFIVRICCEKCKDPEQMLLVIAGGSYKQAKNTTSAATGDDDHPIIMENYKLSIPRLAVFFPLFQQRSLRPEVAGMLVRFKVLEELDLFRERKIEGSKQQKTAAAKQEEKKSDTAKQELLKTWGGLKQETIAFCEEKLEAIIVEMDLVVGELDKNITTMADELAVGTYGPAYLYSWLSSYNMQRASTMGSPGMVAEKEFLTPAMKDELEAAARKKKSQLLAHQDAAAASLVRQAVQGKTKQQRVGQDEAAAARVCMCRFLDLDLINKRLKFWGNEKVKSLIVSPELDAAGDSDDRLFIIAATTRSEGSLERINQKMYQDIFDWVAKQVVDKMQCKCNCETP